MSLQEVMVSRRRAFSLTQKDLAEKSGIGIATIKDIERGKANPSLSTISRILAILGSEISFRVVE